jgi:peptide/nickel transport system substrate-binding protein
MWSWKASAGVMTRTVAAAALLVVAQAARAGQPGVLVSGDNLPANVDPHQIFDVPMQLYSLNAYDNLYRYEGNPPNNMPWLAPSHTVSADGLTWEFKLRPGVRFHDGSEITADDVVYSFQRVLALGKAPSGAFKPVLRPDNITASDASTVRFVLDRPYAPFLAAIPIVMIVNPRVVKQHEVNGDWGAAWLASNDAGSGAYSLDAATYRPLERADLKRFAGHFLGWKDNPAAPELIQILPTRETSTRVLALLQGSVDLTDSYLPTDQVERIARSKGVHIEKNTSMRVFVLRMNNSKPPLDNLNARKCLAHAFNYDGFIKEILKGYAERNPAPLPNNLWGYPKDVVGYDYDLKKAKAFCDRATAEGAPINRPLEIHTQSQLEQTNQAAQLLQSDLAQIGVNLKIIADTWANITTNTAKPESTPDLWVHWVSTYFVDPENWVGQMYDSQFQGTWKASAWYQNAKVDALLRKARTVVAEAERRPLYEEATRLIVADSPDIWVYNTVEIRGVTDRVQGFRFSPVGSGGELRWVRLEH